MSTDKNRILPLNPHYSDPRFSRGNTETVYGQEEKGLHYNYSDRIWQWDYNKAKEASLIASEIARPNTARWLEVYLSAFHGALADLRHVMVGVNVSNGYAYHVYGYKLKAVKP